MAERMAGSKITAAHWQRGACVYVRQSTVFQVRHHRESNERQYCLGQRALALGWAPSAITIIDEDQGQSATSADHRHGFQRLVAAVAAGKVGILLMLEASRLARCGSDWHRLIELCSLTCTLIADDQAVYDPREPNDRLLLGVKGQLSELELHTIRARLTAGLLNKAQRGELALTLPVGLARDPSGVVHKNPNLEVQHRLELVFSTFLTARSASQVLRVFNDQGLTLPRRDRFGAVVWRKPTVAAILSILKHPAYAGAFTYGRTGPGPRHARLWKLPLEDWKIRLNDRYPAYIAYFTP